MTKYEEKPKKKQNSVPRERVNSGICRRDEKAMKILFGTLLLINFGETEVIIKQ